MKGFESTAVDTRMPAPPVDGVLEVHCPKKLGQVIAAQRCLDAQDEGCSCAVKVGEIVRLSLVRAKETRSPASGVRGRNKDERNARIRELVEAGVPLMKIAKEHRLSRQTVKQIAASEAGR